MSVEFHRLEEWDDPRKAMSVEPYIFCSFETDRFGIFQVKYKHGKLKQLENEPSIMMFSEKEQSYIWKVCAIVWRMVFDAPAATDRFKCDDVVVSPNARQT